ncbi:NAD(P)-binding protein [Coniophora puteana RWD-64-598 SS2]|uniref:NAD(P)-binding protein n=1 Tax=Coniophora puteana (strain RWD-64-598) TaxID=741705 RepID=A0A5M3MB16_CONPW|nr:NAD(P)-binding protein [Coniophora puteana RWD-64-598 SS2]EIW76273.1 NAD(P)-binding protein [Coniophora puteana RWD-64-598 SS2]
MRVLVIGGTGYVGIPVVQALVRAGHVVFALARTQEKAKQLAAEEATPVLGDISDVDSWIHLIPTLDVVVDIQGGMFGVGTALFQAVKKEVLRTRADGPKLAYIMTSGTWVHGDDRKEVVTDTTPTPNPINFSAWRVPVEKEVTSDTVLNGIVIRPSIVYGRSGGACFSPLFEGASKGKVEWFGTPGGRYSVVHLDDLADLYLRVAEKSQMLGGQIFDAANPLSESVDDLLQKMVEVSGAKGPYKYGAQPPNPLFEGIQTTTMLRPYLGRTLVDWVPKKPGLIDGLPVWYASWQASQ